MVAIIRLSFVFATINPEPAPSDSCVPTILIIILIAATDGEMRVLIIMKIIMGISRRNLIRDADRERMAVKIIRTEWVRKLPS